MEIFCPHCKQRLEYSDHPPRFCQDCGHCLTPSQPPSEALLSADRTIAPTSLPQELPAVPTGVDETVGPYRTVAWLGSGGMGSVWQAEETGTGRRVALKRLATSFASDESSLTRFRLEAQLAAQISHPNVTFIYSTGDHQGLPFIAMELMPGNTLEDLVRSKGMLDVSQAIDHILDVIEGLQAVHQQGMIHRDIKPANCFLGSDGNVKIGDFGLSKAIDQQDANLTKTGTFMGTPSYASPEQIRGMELDSRTDLYSAGATLFFLLAARTPFSGDATSMMAQIIGDPAPSIRQYNRSVPRDLDLIIQKCLAKSADDRFHTLDQLKLALLPYASQFNSVTDAGRRLAAYMIDQSLLQLIGFLGVMVAVILAILKNDGPLSTEQQSAYLFWPSVVMLVVTLMYYSVFEGWYGRGLGKWLMGLRLLDAEGQRAGFWRALLRTLFVPVGLGIPTGIIGWKYFHGNLVPPTNPADITLTMITSLAITFPPVLICLATMRSSNRLLGLHGWISGTRVVRAATVTEMASIPIADLKPRQVTTQTFGPYQTDQLLLLSEPERVFLAHDEQLRRHVWIVVDEGNTQPSPARMSLARHARQRWLDGGPLKTTADSHTELRWDAFEAVDGMPIQQFVGMSRFDQCGGYARLMRQLVEELSDAIVDQTLPRALGLAQVWLNRDGHIKLLDRKLVKAIHGSDMDTSTCLLSGKAESMERSPEQRAVELVQQLGDLMQRQRILPGSLSSFLKQLFQHPKNRETLNWARRELANLEQRVTRLTWDHRIGILAVTLGVEAVVFTLVSAVLMLVCFYFAPVPTAARYAVGVMISLLMPMAMAAYFDGGFVFQAMGIRVCRQDGKRASRFRSALRAGLSWFPMIAMLGAFLLLMLFSDASQKMLEAEPGTIDYEVIHNAGLKLSAMIALLVSAVSIGVGILFAILSPRRGLVDYLLQTRLIPD